MHLCIYLSIHLFIIYLFIYNIIEFFASLMAEIQLIMNYR